MLEYEDDDDHSDDFGDDESDEDTERASRESFYPRTSACLAVPM